MKHRKAVLLDTSFFLRFLNEDDSLFKNADGYFRYFLQNNLDMLISTISIAEYCIGGSIDELPLKNLQVLPFNLSHAQRTGEFARIAFDARKEGVLALNDRKIIPNDTKLFAQADSEPFINFYLSSDNRSLKVYKVIREKIQPKFDFIDLNTPYRETFGLLDFGE